MKRLTENEFEKIFVNIKDLDAIDFSKIVNFDNLHEDDQTRIIREWTIYRSEDYKIDLANKIIQENDDEPYTEARISRSLNITLSLSKIIKDYILLIEDGEIYVPTNREKSIQKLKSLLFPILNSKNIEPERTKILKQELDGLCEKGDPERMILAYKIVKLLKAMKKYFVIKGNLTSSLVAYYLGIHDIDCFKYHINYHLCHGDDFLKTYTIVFQVSQDDQDEINKIIETFFEDNHEVVFGKLCTEKDKCGNQFILSNRLFVSKTRDILNKCIFLTNQYNQKYKCITKSDADKFGFNQIQIRTEGRSNTTFLKMMNQLHPYNDLNISLDDVDSLNELLFNNATIPLNHFGFDFIYNKFKKKKYLLFDEFVECISHHFDSLNIIKENIPYSVIHKGDIISVCYDLLKICFYLRNYTDESVKPYVYTKFIYSDIKNNKIVNSTKHEQENHKLFLNEYISKFQTRFVGTFLFLDNKLLSNKTKLFIDQSKEIIDSDVCSIKSSNSFNGLISLKGKVVYNVKRQTFYIYVDKSLIKEKEKIKLIKNEFALPKYNVLVKHN